MAIRRRAIALVVGLLLALVVAEAGLRLGRMVWPQLHGMTYSPTVRTAYDEVESTRDLLERSYFGYQPLAETPGLRLNSRGFRTPEYREEKAEGVLRMAVLGDSFAFGANGVAYQDLWHQVAARRLEAVTGRPVEVVNLGMPAVGPRFALRLWELEGERLEPDLVVLGFFVGNDLTDEGDEPLEATLDGGLAQHSLLVRLVRNGLRQRRGLAAAPEGPGAATAGAGGEAGGSALPLTAGGFDPEAPLMTEEAWLGVEEGRLLAIAGPDTGRFSRLVAGANLLLERLAREVEASGARFVVLLIPDEGQVDRDLARRIERRSGFPLDLDRAQRHLLPWLEDRRIPHLDLLPLFRRHHEAGEHLYRLQDTHWNTAGNRLAGEALADHVLTEGLAPGG